MHPAHLARVCEEFALGTPISLETDHEGVLNLNYLLRTDSGSYFIKSVRDRRKDSIPVIAAAETFMAVAGIPAITMRHTRSGELYLPHESEVYTVYPYVLHAVPQSMPYAELGRMLARIHLRGSQPLPPLLTDVQMTEKQPDRVLAKLTGYRELAQRSRDPIDDIFLAYIDRKLELLPLLPAADPASPTLLHGDYHSRNVLFDERGNILGICDWEKTELGPRAYEIARSVHYICFANREAPYSYELEEAIRSGREFIAAYRSEYPISDDELRHGFRLRLRKLVMTFWMEERYYDHGDERANKFLNNDIQVLFEFAEPSIVEALVQ